MFWWWDSNSVPLDLKLSPLTSQPFLFLSQNCCILGFDKKPKILWIERSAHKSCIEVNKKLPSGMHNSRVSKGSGSSCRRWVGMLAITQIVQWDLGVSSQSAQSGSSCCRSVGTLEITQIAQSAIMPLTIGEQKKIGWWSTIEKKNSIIFSRMLYFFVKNNDLLAILSGSSDSQ